MDTETIAVSSAVGRSASIGTGCGSGHWSLGHGTERARRHTINHELEINVVVWELDEVRQIEHSAEFARDVGCVLGAETERDDRAGVAEHRVPYVGFELVQVLVRDREAEPVFAHFREHVRHGKRREALELIYIDEEVPALGWIDIGAAIPGKTDRGDQKAAEKR